MSINIVLPIQHSVFDWNIKYVLSSYLAYRVSIITPSIMNLLTAKQSVTVILPAVFVYSRGTGHFLTPISPPTEKPFHYKLVIFTALFLYDRQILAVEPRITIPSYE